MRTTIRMNEAIARQMKAMAHETGTTFTTLVERACVEFLKNGGLKRRRRLKPLPTANLGGAAPGVDLDHTGRLIADLDYELLPTLAPPAAAPAADRARNGRTNRAGRR